MWTRTPELVLLLAVIVALGVLGAVALSGSLDHAQTTENEIVVGQPPTDEVTPQWDDLTEEDQTRVLWRGHWADLSARDQDELCTDARDLGAEAAADRVPDQISAAVHLPTLSGLIEESCGFAQASEGGDR